MPVDSKQHKSPLDDVNFWRTRLGLMPVPLIDDKDPRNTYVLLNGTRGNFCLGLQQGRVEERTRNCAWSADVGYYLAVVGREIEVQRWDDRINSVEKYDSASVHDKIEAFYAYLEKGSPNREYSIIAHAIRVFRSLRAALGRDCDGEQSLKVFLHLLASAVSVNQNGRNPASGLEVPDDGANIANSLRSPDWEVLLDEFARGRPIERLIPDLNLLLRHASGQLFQEAHYEAIFVPQEQLLLGGFLPPPVEVRQQSKSVGLHYTPAAIARVVVEESLACAELSRPSILLLDPACGSAEFLREALRQLKLKQFKGQIRLLGMDVSEAACDMARFALSWERIGYENQVEIEIRQMDSLSNQTKWPENVDLVLMNPPFVSWQDMSPDQRETVSQVLGDLTKQRPDLSHAFVLKSADCLRKGGVLGTILPASFLDGTSAEPLRNHLQTELSARTIARLGSHFIFSNAIVDTGFYVGTKGTDAAATTTAFWADHRPQSSAKGLRTLRQLRDAGSRAAYPIAEAGYSIYLNADLGATSTSWAPRPYTAWKLQQALSLMPRVRDVFDVKQGVRTGHNATFVLMKDQWKSLGRKERTYFRPAVINDSINAGRLSDCAYVFYPYGDRAIIDESELRDVVPRYYERFLLRDREILLARARNTPDRWWQLILHRTWQIERNPKIVSTYFGDAGAFAWDSTGEYVVVQGLGWLPKGKNAANFTERVGLSYLAVLNSPLFSRLLAYWSNQVGGGQWNLSTKFVENIPLPNLLKSDANPALLDDLAELGGRFHSGDEVDKDKQAELVSLLYGLEEPV